MLMGCMYVCSFDLKKVGAYIYMARSGKVEWFVCLSGITFVCMYVYMGCGMGLGV